MIRLLLIFTISFTLFLGEVYSLPYKLADQSSEIELSESTHKYIAPYRAFIKRSEKSVYGERHNHRSLSVLTVSSRKIPDFILPSHRIHLILMQFLI